MRKSMCFLAALLAAATALGCTSESPSSSIHESSKAGTPEPLVKSGKSKARSKRTVPGPSSKKLFGTAPNPES